MPPEHQLIDENAKRELVGAHAGWLTDELLGRHVSRRAGHDPRLAQDGAGPALVNHRVELRQAEVENLHRSIGQPDDVLGFEIAVGDAAFVRRGERARDVECGGHGQGKRQRPTLQLVP